MISELAIRLYGRLEQVGYIIPDEGKNGKEIRPDVSVGKMFAKWLKSNLPEDSESFKKYEHLLPAGLTVPARPAILIMTLDGFPNCKFTVLLNVNSARYAAWKFIIRIADRGVSPLITSTHLHPSPLR